MPADAASLFDLEPSLGRIVGAGVAARIGRRPILPVLVVDAGEWVPPARDRLGEEVFALAVIDGLLLGVGNARFVLGPGDRFAPWTDSRRWTAGTDVRLAVLGRAFADALSAWPQAAARLRAGPSANYAHAAPPGPLQEQVLELLWRIARRWGTLEAGGFVLPAGIVAASLARLASETEANVAQALAGLGERELVIARPNGGWALAIPDQGGRQQQLSARLAEQFAIARAHASAYAELSELFEFERRRRDAGPRSRRV